MSKIFLKILSVSLLVLSCEVKEYKQEEDPCYKESQEVVSGKTRVLKGRYTRFLLATENNITINCEFAEYNNLKFGDTIIVSNSSCGQYADEWYFKRKK